MCHTLSISFNSNISHALHCSQTWGKGHQWQKILIIDYSQPQKKTKCISHKAWSAPRPAENLEETNHNGKKYLKRIIFHKLQQSSMPTSIRMKTRGTFIISCNSNINHTFTFPKTGGKQPKQLKIPKDDHFS